MGLLDSLNNTNIAKTQVEKWKQKRSLSKFLKKETKVKDIYFDSVDLVVGEKTVLANAIALKNNFKVSDLVKAILKATK